MDIDRRTTLFLLGAGVAGSHLPAAQQHLHTLAASPKDYKPQFFTPAEFETIDAIAAMIIPADSRSPGAHEAKAADYIDLVAAHSVNSTWRSRLAAFEDLCRRQYGKTFLALDAAGREAMLNQVARNEAHPTTPPELFFADMKHVTVFAYYTSEIGLRKELGYKGNEALGSFPGCQPSP